jgi:hypothetical protein
MRKEYGKALRDAFAERMKTRFSQFQALTVRTQYFFPGDRAYRWIPREPVHCWIVLHPSKKDYDWFNVLVGWSRLARYPELGMVPCMEQPSAHRQEFENDEYLTRLPYLFDGGKDTWWEVRAFEPPTSLEELAKWVAPISVHEAREAVKPLVVDAMDKIAEYAVPYLRELAEASREIRS